MKRSDRHRSRPRRWATTVLGVLITVGPIVGSTTVMADHVWRGHIHRHGLFARRRDRRPTAARRDSETVRPAPRLYRQRHHDRPGTGPRPPAARPSTGRQGHGRRRGDHQLVRRGRRRPRAPSTGSPVAGPCRSVRRPRHRVLGHLDRPRRLGPGEHRPHPGRDGAEHCRHTDNTDRARTAWYETLPTDPSPSRSQPRLAGRPDVRRDLPGGHTTTWVVEIKDTTKGWSFGTNNHLHRTDHLGGVDRRSSYRVDQPVDAGRLRERAVHDSHMPGSTTNFR